MNFTKIAAGAALLSAVVVAQADTVDSGAMTTFTAGSPALAEDVNGNFTAITTAVDDNATDIGTNAAAIADNASDIADNAAGVSTNASGIATNASGISTNTGGIASNAAAITNNATGIADNTAAISSNSADISANSGLISENAAAVSGNSTDISVNSGLISDNAAAIAINNTAISNLDTVVNGNGDGIDTNAAAIAALQATVASLQSQIDDLETGSGTGTGPAEVTEAADLVGREYCVISSFSGADSDPGNGFARINQGTEVLNFNITSATQMSVVTVVNNEYELGMNLAYDAVNDTNYLTSQLDTSLTDTTDMTVDITGLSNGVMSTSIGINFYVSKYGDVMIAREYDPSEGIWSSVIIAVECR